MNKFILTILFSLALENSYSQKLSKAVEDTSITNFMTWLFRNDAKFRPTRHLDNDIIDWQQDEVVYYSNDTTVIGLTQPLFSTGTGLKNILNSRDADFFSEQISGSQKKWNLKIKGIALFDTVELENNRIGKTLYSYSLPLFSMDRRYVVIKEGFFCGLVCGGGSYNLYERQEGGNWKKIKTFNVWAE